MSKTLVSYIESLEDRDRGFFELLDDADDLGMIIRAQLYVEHELREFILASAPAASAVKFSDFDFSGLVRLALALGLDEKLEKGLLSIASLRNKFAHQLEASFTEEEANQIYKSLSADYRSDAINAYRHVAEKVKEEGRPSELTKAPPKNLIAICILMLRTGVVHGHVTLRTAKIRGNN